MKTLYESGSVCFRPFPQGSDIAEDFPLLDFLPDESDWEIVVVNDTHKEVEDGFATLFLADVTDALTCVIPGGDRQVYLVSFHTTDWSVILYRMGKMDATGRARIMSHAASLSRALTCESIAMWGLDFFVYDCGGNLNEKASRRMASRDYDGDPVLEDVMEFISNRNLRIPPMWITSLLKTGISLYGVPRDEVHAVSILRIAAEHW